MDGTRVVAAVVAASGVRRLHDPGQLRAKQAGLTFRPLAESVRSTLAWENELGLDRERRAGLGTQWERDLVARWEH